MVYNFDYSADDPFATKFNQCNPNILIMIIFPIVRIAAGAIPGINRSLSVKRARWFIILHPDLPLKIDQRTNTDHPVGRSPRDRVRTGPTLLRAAVSRKHQR